MPKENLYIEGHIRTHSGIYVKILDPKPEMFDIQDIAHALSRQCRFSGHLEAAYTVGQHSIHVAQLITHKRYKLTALMHDASEAYLVDLPTPIKKEMRIYRDVEERMMKVLAEKFGFIFPLPQAVKMADKVMLEREWEDLMLQRRQSIKIKGESEAVLHSEAVKNKFLFLFNEFSN